MIRWASVVCAIVALPAICAAAEEVKPATRPIADANKPWILHIPGIGGESPIDATMIAGLRDAGFKGDIEVLPWVKKPGLPALLAYEQNRQEAAKAAEQITRQFRAAPDAPIVLTSHSAGGAIAVWALEDLPEDVVVESVLLLLPALSPTYDLTRALSHVRGRAYVFSSPHDFMVLGAGTKVFGTMDGKRVRSAGMVGFDRPPGADEKQYQKIELHPYDPAWMKLANIGDHIGVMSRPFSSKVLAPLVVAAITREQPATRPAQ